MRSIDKIESTLRERIETLERELAIQEFAEKLWLREFPVLHGKRAVSALQNFVDEIEEREGQELNDRQIDALKELANGLIISIRAEMSLAHKRIRTYIS